MASVLWPTGLAADQKDYVRTVLEEQAARETQDPIWSYFTIARAHQWLLLDEPARAWSIVDRVYAYSAFPRLGVFSEGTHEENSFHLWPDYRGWVRPPHVTPHYWASSEMLLFAIDALAYVDEEGDTATLVIGAGMKPEWLDGPFTVRGLNTALGSVSWQWDGNAVTIAALGVSGPVRLGTAFPAGTPVRLAPLN